MRTENRMCMCTYPLISSLILLKLNHQALSTADFLHFVLHHNQILLNFLFFNCCYCFFFSDVCQILGRCQIYRENVDNDAFVRK